MADAGIGASRSKPSADAGAHIPRSREVSATLDWKHISSAPRDGAWVFLRNEDDRVAIGRWEPTPFKIGSQTLTYAWRVFEGGHYDNFEAPKLSYEDVWNFWADGHACDWAPLGAARDMGSRVAAQVADDASGRDK